MAFELDTSRGTVTNIMQNILNLRRFSTKWVPHTLTDPQKAKRREMAAAMLATLQAEEANGFQRVITMDESWIPWSLPHDSVWGPEGTARPEAPKMKVGMPKTMVVVFWSADGILFRTYLPEKTTVTANYFTKQCLDPLKIQLGLRADGPPQYILHMDNARPHTAHMTKDFLATSPFVLLPHPPYSPDIAPSDFHLFGNMKRSLKGLDAKSRDELIDAVDRFLLPLNRTTLLPVFRHWLNRLTKVMATGEYYTPDK
jgi:histone-lysine N-methyltransferase SETMAR